MAHTSFGQLLRNHRLRLGLTQERVAERAGLSARAIQKLEHGATQPYRDTTDRLVRALELSAAEEAEFRQWAQPAPRQRRHVVSPLLAGGGLGQTDLPLWLTSFVGRQREIVELGALLSSARLVTLTGVGGCGKTRLAVEVARKQSARFGDGVALVELASVADGALVPEAIASALGIREAATQSVSETLCAVLKSREVLLLLDNCEHVLDATAQIASSLLRSCAGVTILATSREALGLTGEVSWSVPSLPLPPLNLLPEPEHMAEFAAVQLFLERAHEAHPQFVMTQGNAAAIAQVCHRLDGIPLALELAAVRVRGMSVEELAKRLDHRFRLLTSGSRAALPRQQTLRATIDWSYQLLTATERVLFRRLSVFPGKWTIEAAEAVCGGRGIELEDVLELVLRLVDKSLVVVDDNTPRGQRYELLRSLRQYGREQLVDANEADALHEVHALNFLDLAEKTESARLHLEAGGWTGELEDHLADLEAALEWFIAQADAERALRLAGVLWHLWEVRGALTYGRRRLTSVLTLPGAELPTLEHARAANGAGVLALNQHDIAGARRMLRESLELYQLHGHTRGVAWVLIHLAWLALDTGRSRAAARILERAHALCEEIGDRLGIARCLQLEGYLAWWHGNLEASRELHMRSADLSRELCDRWGTAWALHRLCVTLCALAERDGDVAPMPHLIHEALGLWRELGERRHFAFSLCDQAIDVGLRGEFEAALGSLDEAHSIFAALEDDFGICCVFMNHCVLLAARGEFGAAVRVTAALFSRSGGRMDRVPVPIRDRVANLLRDMEATHGPDLTRATWEMGRRMTMTEVIDFVQTVVSRTASQVAVV